MWSATRRLQGKRANSLPTDTIRKAPNLVYDTEQTRSSPYVHQNDSRLSARSALRPERDLFFEGFSSAIDHVSKSPDHFMNAMASGLSARKKLKHAIAKFTIRCRLSLIVAFRGGR
jgi:hypothetical protein